MVKSGPQESTDIEQRGPEESVPREASDLSDEVQVSLGAYAQASESAANQAEAEAEANPEVDQGAPTSTAVDGDAGETVYETLDETEWNRSPVASRGEEAAGEQVAGGDHGERDREGPSSVQSAEGRGVTRRGDTLVAEGRTVETAKSDVREEHTLDTGPRVVEDGTATRMRDVSQAETHETDREYKSRQDARDVDSAGQSKQTTGHYPEQADRPEDIYDRMGVNESEILDEGPDRLEEQLRGKFMAPAEQIAGEQAELEAKNQGWAVLHQAVDDPIANGREEFEESRDTYAERAQENLRDRDTAYASMVRNLRVEPGESNESVGPYVPVGDIDGVSDEAAEALRDHGYVTAADAIGTDPMDYSDIDGVDHVEALALHAEVTEGGSTAEAREYVERVDAATEEIVDTLNPEIAKCDGATQEEVVRDVVEYGMMHGQRPLETLEDFKANDVEFGCTRSLDDIQTHVLSEDLSTGSVEGEPIKGEVISSYEPNGEQYQVVYVQDARSEEIAKLTYWSSDVSHSPRSRHLGYEGNDSLTSDPTDDAGLHEGEAMSIGDTVVIENYEVDEYAGDEYSTVSFALESTDRTELKWDDGIRAESPSDTRGAAIKASSPDWDKRFEKYGGYNHKHPKWNVEGGGSPESESGTGSQSSNNSTEDRSGSE